MLRALLTPEAWVSVAAPPLCQCRSKTWGNSNPFSLHKSSRGRRRVGSRRSGDLATEFPTGLSLLLKAWYSLYDWAVLGVLVSEHLEIKNNGDCGGKMKAL